MKSDQVHRARLREGAKPGASLAAFLAACLLVGAFNLRPALTSLATVLAEVHESLGISSVWTGALTTIPVICFGIFGPLAPALSARLGLERATGLLLALLGFGLALRSIPHPVLFTLSTLLAGAAIGMAGVLLPVVIRRNFPDKLGLMTGIYTMVLSLGGAGAAGLTPLIERTAGNWTWALAVWSVPAFLGALLWGVLSLSRTNGPRTAPLPRFSALLRDRVAWSVTLFMGLQAGLAFIVLGWLPTLLRDRGLGGLEAGFVTSVSIMAQTATALLVPAVAVKRASPHILIIIVLSATAAGFLGLLYAPLSSRVLWALFLGLGQGGLFGLALLFISLRSASPDAAAMLSGMSQSIGYLGASLCPLAVSFLRDLAFGSDGTAGLVLGLVLLCSVCGLKAANPGCVLQKP